MAAANNSKEKIGLELLDDMTTKKHSTYAYPSIKKGMKCGADPNGSNYCSECGARFIKLSDCIHDYYNYSPSNFCIMLDDAGDFFADEKLDDFTIHTMEYGLKPKSMRVYYRKFSQIHVSGKGHYDSFSQKIRIINAQIDSYEESIRILDMDLTREPKIIITQDGVLLKNTLKNMREICSGVDVWNADNPTNHMDNVIYTVSRVLSTGSLFTAIDFLIKYPAVESILAEGKFVAGFFEQWSNNKSRFAKEAKTPAEMLGLPNRIYQSIISIKNCVNVIQSDHDRALCTYLYKLAKRPWELDVNQLSKLLDILVKFANAGVREWNLEKVQNLMNLGFDHDKLFSYLTEEVYTYQGIESPNDAIITLCDYISLQTQMNVPYVRYPKSLKLNHDLAVKNHNVIIDEEKKKKFQEFVSTDDYKDAEWNNDKYAIIAPTEARDLVKEGCTLNHCVKSYVDRLCDRETKIYFLRKVKEADKPYITVEVATSGVVVQARGFGDRWVNKEEAETLIQWGKHKHINTSLLNSRNAA